MTITKRLTKVYNTADKITFHDSSKIVLISDCHRGDGNWGDNFLKNQNLYFAALTYYYKENFTYIELGDGDELWENRKLEPIITTHSDAFWIMSKFYKKKRLHMLYGNHDIVKSKPGYALANLKYYYNEALKKRVPLFPGIKIHEGLILHHMDSDNTIFLVHGHQADYLNYDFWRLSRFLVRYLWRPLELIGIHDPTSTSSNYKKKVKVEKRLIDWSLKNNQMLIAGHTHRPVFPKADEPQYFNDGSCVHPRCITAIEIENGCITLVKWTIKTKPDRTLYVGRVVLDGPVKLTDYFSRSTKSIT